MTASTLSFIIEPLHPPDQMALVAVPVIDGRPLTDLVEESEPEFPSIRASALYIESRILRMRREAT
jgi:hypothetical protein